MDISAEPTSPTSPDSNLLTWLDFWADDIMCLFLIRSKDLKKRLQLLWVTSQHEISVDTLPCKSQANKKFLLISPDFSGSSSSMVSAMKLLPLIFGKPSEKAGYLPCQIRCALKAGMVKREHLSYMSLVWHISKCAHAFLHDTLLSKIWGAFQQGIQQGMQGMQGMQGISIN